MPWSNVNLVLNVRDRTSGSYQAALFNAENQNIIQGQIHSLSLNEINFPYDIPNVQGVTSGFVLQDANNPDTLIPITLAPGFYTGTELAAAINVVIEGTAAADVTCHYDEISNRFDFTTNAGLWILQSSYTFPPGYTLTQNRGPLGKDILSMMGYAFFGSSPLISQNSPFLPGGTSSGSAPLTFTQYVDVCSPQLCKFQEFQGGSTTNLARRGDVICRLYISNNIAVQESEGTRPFVINRQYYNARVMKWTAGNSVGTIDIQLYDDVGQPLDTESWAPRPYQITFNTYEGGDEKEQVTDAATGQTMLLPKYSPYTPQNARGWSSPTFPMTGR
jgi:hypothetical protein